MYMDMQTLQQRISENWPGRQNEVAKIYSICSSATTCDFFVYGLPSTGKTSVLRECLSLLAKRHAYVQCTETMKPKQLLCSIYSQLYGYKRKKVEGYAGLNVESLADFFKILPDVCLPGKPTSLIVLDDAHWLSRMPQLLRPLLQARERSGGASVAFVLISQQAPGSGEWEALPSRMPTVPFPNYTHGQMVSCLLRMRSKAYIPEGLPPAVHRAYCEHIVSSFKDTTSDIVDLATLSAHLWGSYLEPIETEKVTVIGSTVESLCRRLYSQNFKQAISVVRKIYEPGMRSLPSLTARPPAGADSVYAAAAGGAGGAAKGAQSPALLLELPEMTKLLVIAAYLASYNKPTVDKQIFDVKARSGRIRGRGGANMDSDRQVEAAKEARLKGPHSFQLQRLLTCLSYIQSGREVPELDRQGDGTAAAAVHGSTGAGGHQSPGDEDVSDEDDGGGDRWLEIDLDEDGEENGNIRATSSVGGSASSGRRKAHGQKGGRARGADECLVKPHPTRTEAPWGREALGRTAPWWLRNQRGAAGRKTKGRGGGGGSTFEAADVMSHLSTLASMQLISKATGEAWDPLDGAKYTCHVSEDYAMGLANSLDLRLSAYLKYV